MITLGRNQEKVLDALLSVENTNLDALVELTGIKKEKVRNIVTEFSQAGLVRITPDKTISYVKERFKPSKNAEADHWEPYKPKLKNLSRLV
jgi:transcription initiation factor IIE alpha subunit